jgi:dinuclear metal center YbgI/SA1388 family protein
MVSAARPPSAVIAKSISNVGGQPVATTAANRSQGTADRMSVSLDTVIAIIEKLIPPGLAESWDNVGLQIGDPRWGVKKIRVALDPGPDVVETSCRDGIDLLLTHHPLIFKPLKKIDLGTPQGGLFQKAFAHQMAIYAAHTNYDRLSEGLNEIFAKKIGLKQLRPLEPYAPTAGAEPPNGHGLGRVGVLERAMPLKHLAERLKNQLEIDAVRVAGRAELEVATVALCTGSGSSLMELFLESDAQVYISGDLRYHDARTVEEADLGLIDIGHFASEHLMVEALSKRLATVLQKEGFDIEVSASRIEKDPFQSI